jgi:chromosome segregation ATPase
MFVPRLPADYGHVVIAEIQGREPRGTVERMIEAASGLKRAAETDIAGGAGALLKLAESLKAPDLVRKQINELATAAANSQAQAQAVKDGQAKLERAKEALENLRRDHEAEMTKRTAEVEAACNKREQEAKEIHAKATAALKAAEADAADAAKLKAKLQRKLELIESVA